MQSTYHVQKVVCVECATFVCVYVHILPTNGNFAMYFMSKSISYCIYLSIICLLIFVVLFRVFCLYQVFVCVGLLLFGRRSALGLFV